MSRVRPIDATQLLPQPLWNDPRIHLLDDTWLLTIFTILIATALPWATGGLDVSFALASLGVLVLAAIHIGFTALTDPSRPPTAWRSRELIALHAAGIIAIGFTWQHVGGLQNPLFLLAFALPVTASIFLSRWQPYLMATLAVVVVVAVALSQAPELRWYATGLNGAGAWIAAVLGQVSGEHSAATTAPFPGFYAPSSYFVVLLEVFAVLLFACAVAAEYLGTVFDRLAANVTAARAEAERGQELWAALIENFPLPALLVDANTLQIICASEHVPAKFCETDEPLAGRRLLDTIGFSYPDVVQELVTGAGGVAPLNMIRARGRLHAAEVRVQHVAQRGRRFALVIIRETTEELCVRAALDMADYAALVLDARGTILGLNKAARGLFSGADIGADASTLLVQPGLSQSAWWQPGLSGRRKMHVQILQRLYQVTSAAIALPGEEERLYVTAFVPVARAAAYDQTGIHPVLTQSTSGQRP